MLASARGRLLGIAAVVLVVGASACGDTNPADVGGTGASAGPGSDVRVALSFDIGGLGDLGFNDSAYKGMQDAVRDGLVRAENTEYLESNASGSNRDSNTEALADQGFDLVVCVGYPFSPGVNQLARQYPDTDFAVVDGYSKDAPNVTNLTFEENEGSFLVGAARSVFTGRGVFRSGIDMFVVGLGVAIVGYFVGEWIGGML